MTQISDRYHALAADFTRRVDAVPEGRWNDPTPCEGWSALDLLKHVVDTTRTAPTWAGLPEIETQHSDPRQAWPEVRDAVQVMLDDPETAGTQYSGYFGPTTLAESVNNFIGFDLLIHAWDLARATGQDEALPPDEVHTTYEGALQMGDALRTQGVCGPAIEVPADAPEQDRLLAFLGRQP
jgi:uncharacterized protein (TIGR03086 family)